jgi:hypothetical protein
MHCTKLTSGKVPIPSPRYIRVLILGMQMFKSASFPVASMMRLAA